MLSHVEILFYFPHCRDGAMVDAWREINGLCHIHQGATMAREPLWPDQTYPRNNWTHSGQSFTHEMKMELLHFLVPLFFFFLLLAFCCSIYFCLFFLVLIDLFRFFGFCFCFLSLFLFVFLPFAQSFMLVLTLSCQG